MSTPLKNRDEVIAFVNALTAIHTEANYKDLLAQQMADNLVFRKEVTGTLAGSGPVAVDFAGKDYIELTLSGNSTITISNVDLGENKILKIVKGAGQTVAFSGASDQTPDADNVTGLTVIYYHVYKKDTLATIVVQPISKTFGAATETAKGIAEIATPAETKTGTDNTRVVTPKSVRDGLFVDSGWLNLINLNPGGEFSNITAKVRQIGHNVVFFATFDVPVSGGDLTSSYALGDLPVGITAPSQTIRGAASTDKDTKGANAFIGSNGTVSIRLEKLAAESLQSVYTNIPYLVDV
jgi:hypothetical protein